MNYDIQLGGDVSEVQWLITSARRIWRINSTRENALEDFTISLTSALNFDFFLDSGF